MALLEIKDLEVNYGVIKAIKGVSFDVNEGEIIALIGANGAGKTTILHTITGLIQAKKGSIVFDGKELIPARINPKLPQLLKWFTSVFRDLRNVKIRLQVRCRAVSSRCLQWAEHLCPSRELF